MSETSEKLIDEMLSDALDPDVSEKWLRLSRVELSLYINDIETKLARRDEIIARLKEDATRLFVNPHYLDANRVWQCEYCGVVAVVGDTVKHTPDCPITLHRQLMDELEEK